MNEGELNVLHETKCHERKHIESRVVVCKLVYLPCVFAEGYTVNHLVEEV